MSRAALAAFALALVVQAARAEPETFEAARLADLDDEAALAELVRRRVPFERAAPTPGIRLPVRLTGRMHGVLVRGSLPEAERGSSPFELLDARLALALDRLCELLSRHEIVELIHFTMYRPPDPGVAPGAALHRHPGGLAVDVGALVKRGGSQLVVKEHWPAAVGARTCGPRARELPTWPGRELVSLTCEASDLGLFHVILTPHHDRAHHDHLHLEVREGARFRLLR
ncbi:MAG: extensin family protein [Deltaproteobacteria bacterium]|nr:extensin family protein [Deltaproteobacteria bacterium]